MASHFAPLLGRSEDLKLNYGQLWHRLNDPLVLGTQPLLALPCDRVLNVALAPENHLADVEPVSDDAVGALAGAIDGARGPLPTTRRRDTLAIEVSDDDERRAALDVFSEDAPNDLGLLRHDSEHAVYGHVAVDSASRRLTSPHAADESAPRLLGEILQEQR
ncbi:MAG: hypothetical protein J0H65_12095 [Rhizobiales bacterium]|nr:hypothetical protein [Hyphomicrobiales bacterium]